MRIAQMAADGLTNRDIAQALFVTPKTVERSRRTNFGVSP
jgi:DNA-binding NarL/FixJ family response regulator